MTRDRRTREAIAVAALLPAFLIGDVVVHPLM